MFPFSGGTKGSNLDTFDFLSPKTDDFEEWKKKHDLGDPPPPSLTWTRHLENGFPPHQVFFSFFFFFSFSLFLSLSFVGEGRKIYSNEFCNF